MIGKPIPAIGLGIEVGIDKLKTGLDSAKSQISSFGSHPAFAVATAAFAGIAVAATAVTAAVGTASAVLTKMALEGMTNAAELTKMSRELGVSSATLDEWRYAAGMTGIEAKMFGDSILRMNVQLGLAAAKGVGPLAESFKRLGWDVKEFAQLNAEERFDRIADAVAGMNSQAEKVAFLQELGMDPHTVDLWEQGSEAIAATREEARALGLVLSDEQAKSINQANDSVDKSKKAWAALSDQWAAAVAPAIYTVAEEFADAIKEGGNWQNNMVSWVEEGIYWIETMLTVAQKLYGVLQLGQRGTTVLIKEMVDGLLFYAQASDKVFGTDLAAGLAIYSEELGKTVDELGVEMKKNLFATGEDTWGAQADKVYRERSAELRAMFGNFEESNDLMAQVSEQANADAQKYLESLQKQFDLTEMTTEQYELQRLAQAGADETILKEIEAMQERLRLLKEEEQFRKDIEASDKNVQSMASTFLKMIETPAERTAFELERLRETFDAGFLDQRQFDAIRAKIEGSDGAGDRAAGVVSAMEEGSSAATEIIARFRAGRSAEDQIAKNTQKQYEEQVKTNRLLRDAIVGEPASLPTELV